MRVGGSPGTRLIENGFQRRGNAQDFIKGGAWGHGEALLIFLGKVQALNQNPFSALRLSLSYPFRMLDMKRDLSKLQHTEYVRYYWYARPDSNGGPTDSKSGALSN